MGRFDKLKKKLDEKARTMTLNAQARDVCDELWKREVRPQVLKAAQRAKNALSGPSRSISIGDDADEMVSIVFVPPGFEEGDALPALRISSGMTTNRAHTLLVSESDWRDGMADEQQVKELYVQNLDDDGIDEVIEEWMSEVADAFGPGADSDEPLDLEAEGDFDVFSIEEE